MTEIYHRRSDCRLCGKTKLTLVFKLEPTPPANAFVKKDDLDKNQTCFPLDVFFCESCYHLQLLDVIDPKILFENYVFVSGTSLVTVKHFEDYAKNILGSITYLWKVAFLSPQKKAPFAQTTIIKLIGIFVMYCKAASSIIIVL